MYVVTGDDEFDGAGVGQNGYNLIEDQVSDNFFNGAKAFEKFFDFLLLEFKLFGI